jgi:ribonucleoside-diphosphate reductase beta chain
VIEGMLALTGQHFIIDFNEREGTLPGFVRGFNFVARDEHRHVAFGSRFLRDVVAEQPQFRKSIQRTLEEALVVADEVLRPPWVEDVEGYEYFGVSIDETRSFAAQALTRRLKAIGLAPAG